MFQESPEQCNVGERTAEELELVMNATFTDPSDSSAWFYHRWLLDSGVPTPKLHKAVIKNRTIIISFTEKILQSEPLLLLQNQQQININWKSPEQKQFSRVWVGDPIESLDEHKELQIKFRENVCTLRYSQFNEGFIYTQGKNSEEENHDNQLNEQLRSYSQLEEMEPNNKWVVLTSVLLMMKIDCVKFYENILVGMEALLRLDPLRLNYYNDLRSKYVVEHALHVLNKESDEEIRSTIDLSDLGLTTIHDHPDLAFVEEANMGLNSLSNSLHRLSSLHLCKKLSLSSNRIVSLKRFPTLPNLQVLSLRNNELRDKDDVVMIVRNHVLVFLDLRENPVCKDEDLPRIISEVNPHLELCLS